MPKKPASPDLTTRGTPRKIKANRADATLVQEAVSRMNPAFRRWLENRKVLGHTNRMVVVDLHVRKGKSLTEVAEALGITPQAVGQHWKDARQEIAAHAPTTEEDFIALREEMCARLRHTIEQTHIWMPVEDPKTGQEVMMEIPPTPQTLAIRLKAIEQLSKLYGVNLEREAAATGPSPYAAPEQIAEDVKAKLLELHGVGTPQGRET